MKTTVLFFLATLVATSHAACLSNPIRLLRDMALEDCIPDQVQTLRPKQGSGDQLFAKQINCPSWRLAVETGNLIDWSTIPSNCVEYVANYMQGKQYPNDVKLVADIAILYAASFTVKEDGKDIWVLGVEETALSSIPYYAQAGVEWGSYPYNSTRYNEWVAKGTQEALPEMFTLYQALLELGYKVVFLSGLKEYQREAVTSSLKNAGYSTWEMLILREDSSSIPEYKSKIRTQLVEEGYRIIGNVGDQWTAFAGKHPGLSIFKVPNPMYYVS